MKTALLLIHHIRFVGVSLCIAAAESQGVYSVALYKRRSQIRADIAEIEAAA